MQINVPPIPYEGPSFYLPSDLLRFLQPTHRPCEFFPRLKLCVVCYALLRPKIMFICVCLCVRERKRERVEERDREIFILLNKL